MGGCTAFRTHVVRRRAAHEERCPLAQQAVRLLAPLSDRVFRVARHADDVQQPAAGSEARSGARRRLPKVAVRVLSGLVLGEIMGCATFAGGWPFVCAYGAVIFLISKEYSNILNHVLDPPLVPALRWSLFGISIGTLLAAHFGVMTGIFEWAACTMLLLLLVLQGNTKRSGGGAPITFSHLASQVFGVFYVGYLPSFWVRLRAISLPLPSEPAEWLVRLLRLLRWPLETTVGTCATVSLVLCIIAADSFAYFGGKTWGRRPLILVSPKKTVEGAYFGLAGSVVMSLLCNATWGYPGNPIVAVILGINIFVASLLGDIVVSAMKRDAGIKDAGSLIPGHGGIMDRFDSYFFACPMTYFCWYMFLKATGAPLTLVATA